ncbi:hypothetical protein DRJ16_04575 [Candidatus Woesearchaeota archaeon]|nr:MAG: hypothetical protein DRJ16_04575 [Candidatus Woesearchaeota archaeon]
MLHNTFEEIAEYIIKGKGLSPLANKISNWLNQEYVNHEEKRKMENILMNLIKEEKITKFISLAAYIPYRLKSIRVNIELDSEDYQYHDWKSIDDFTGKFLYPDDLFVECNREKGRYVIDVPIPREPVEIMLRLPVTHGSDVRSLSYLSIRVPKYERRYDQKTGRNNAIVLYETLVQYPPQMIVFPRHVKLIKLRENIPKYLEGSELEKILKNYRKEVEEAAKKLGICLESSASLS